MADVFISYARVDKARVAPLVAAIEAEGWSVWWDPEISAGQLFDDQIEAELAAARCVLVVWTPASVASRWVRGEAREAADRGAGEILLTSIDRDGTKAGFDCELTAAVSTAVNIPVIASGGAGTFDHFAEVFSIGCADAALAASIFHFNERRVAALKEYLGGRGIPVRRT